MRTGILDDFLSCTDASAFLPLRLLNTAVKVGDEELRASEDLTHRKMMVWKIKSTRLECDFLQLAMVQRMIFSSLFVDS